MQTFYTMKPDCKEILDVVADIQVPQVSLDADHPEAKFFESYDASGNKYPEEIEANLPSLEEFHSEIKEWATKKPWDIVTKRKYLWVFTENTIQILLESTPNEEALRKCVCHTNVTGNTDARLGGELWFVNNTKTNQREIYFNFKSKRYPPAKDIAELKEEVKRLFMCVGYNNAIFIEDEIKF